MNLFSNFDISASALSAQRTKMDVISENLANIETTSTPEGGPYKKKLAIITEKGRSSDFRSFRDFIKPFRKGEAFDGAGVEVAQIAEDKNAMRAVYIPGHPQADEKGYVRFPDINIVDEMVQMIKSTHIYEANLTALNEAKTIFSKSLEIGK
jgi:flagellar basal-body rod protein FlgC